MSLAGHGWTLWQAVDRRLRPAVAPSSEESWNLTFDDPLAGRLDLTGRLSRGDGRRLVVLVHGLGGCVDSSYMMRFASALEAQGIGSLRLNQRGADRSGQDFYHAGLTEDLTRVLASPELDAFEQIWLVGFSIGGHVVLRYATREVDPRIESVAGICSPLDLASAADDLDRPGYGLYRRYLFSGLFDMYSKMRPVYALAHSLEQVKTARTLRQWDALTVVPRFGFRDTDDYYEKCSVGPRLARLKVPALLLASEGDPMVTARSVRAGLGEGAEQLEVVWARRGGHVAFPRTFDVGLAERPGIEAQVCGWLFGRT